ncbi:MAG: DUF4340 domain-containing protein [Planctomycetota bacterium]
MSDKKLTILGVVAVLMVTWAVVQTQIASRPAGLEQQVITYLIQGLNLDLLDSILVGKGDEAVTLKRSGGQFVVVNKDNYPAQGRQVNELITKVLSIKTREVVTSNPENYADLEVTEEKASSIVKFLDKGGSIITGVLIGKMTNRGSFYVRLVTGEDVYIAEDIQWIRSSATDYINMQILQVNEGDIRSVTVLGENESYSLTSEPNSSEVSLENIPVGMKLKGDEYKRVFSALTDLRLNDVIKASRISKDILFDHSYICRLEDSTVYTLDIGKSDAKTLVKCRAEFTDIEEVVKERRVESEQELKKKEAKLLAREAAEQFNKKHSGWVYEIPDGKASMLMKELSELLEEEQKIETSSESEDEE